jgi:hypothetical protein
MFANADTDASPYRTLYLSAQLYHSSQGHSNSNSNLVLLELQLHLV